ncbi:MAG: terpene cyclase/mutase family protein [Clostridia bacterium]|nr:terpene cyclase/mutase family protein [Clostridia bacterium]
MKRIVTLFLTFVFIATISLYASAATVNVTRELTNVRSVYGEKTELSSFEETLALASVGHLAGKTPFIPKNDGTAEGLAKRILAQTAAGEVPESDNSVNQLKELQQGDGSFGNVDAHCLSMLALTARKEIYNSAKAYEWLMEQQRENGSFSDASKETALAICILSLSENEREREAKENAIAYLTGYESKTSIDTSWQIIGITDGGSNAAAADKNLVEDLLSYRHSSEYSFYRASEDMTTDEEATIMALASLDAVNEGSSMLQRLAKNGNLTYFSPEDAVPLLIFAVVMLGISVVFWIFIFVHKKNTKTLKETKEY